MFVLFYVSAIGQIPKSGKDSAGALEGDWRSQVMSCSAPISHHYENANNIKKQHFSIAIFLKDLVFSEAPYSPFVNRTYGNVNLEIVQFCLNRIALRITELRILSSHGATYCVLVFV